MFSNPKNNTDGVCHICEDNSAFFFEKIGKIAWEKKALYNHGYIVRRKSSHMSRLFLLSCFSPRFLFSSCWRCWKRRNVCFGTTARAYPIPLSNPFHNINKYCSFYPLCRIMLSNEMLNAGSWDVFDGWQNEYMNIFLKKKPSCRSCNLWIVTTLGRIVLIERNTQTAWNTVIRIFEAGKCKDPVHRVRKAEKGFIWNILMNMHCE